MNSILSTDPISENARVAAVEAYSDPAIFGERDFDQIVELAAHMFAVPNVYISLIDRTRQIFRAQLGLPMENLQRDLSFCAATIQGDDVLVVPDTAADERFRAHPLVTGAPEIRFYAGAPLITPEGHRLGALCLIGQDACDFSAVQKIALKQMAGFVVERMELLRLNHAAKRDPLTGLANRETLQRAMEAAVDADDRATVLLIDLDGFKNVNDTFGHAFGDRILQAVSDRFRGLADENWVVARLGGDEFVIFACGVADPLKASARASTVIATMQEPFDLDGQLIHIGASVGIATRSGGESGAVQLLGNADLALYRAKAEGRGCVRVFTQEYRQTALERGSVSMELHDAWESEEFQLYYQPQVRLSDGMLVGGEALLRWRYPYQGVVLPAAFLPVLESSRLAVPVGTWIIREACRQAAEWRRAGCTDFRMGVNLFAAQLRSKTLADTVESALDAHGLPPQALELEITENIVLRGERAMKAQLAYLKSTGVSIAFDDFGTGFASLAMLKDYPVTRLKIDRAFVTGIAGSRSDQAIVDAVVRLADGFGLDVIAEGIETNEQADLITRLRCPEGQGYLFGRPKPAAEFEDTWFGVQTKAPIVQGQAG